MIGRSVDDPCVFVGNFDFEHALAGVRRPSASLLAGALSFAWLSQVQPGDSIQGFEAPDTALEAELLQVGLSLPSDRSRDGARVIPWGWTEPVRKVASEHGWRIHAPSQEAVKAVNSRSFSHQFECDAGPLAPEGLRLLTSPGDLTKATQSLGMRDWIVKAEFGMSGRERIAGRGPPADSQVNWLRNRLRESRVAFFEPKLEIIEECGLQFDIEPSGRIGLVGISRLISTPNGGYRGSLFPGEASGFEAAIRQGYEVASAAAQAGYFGPMGIDAARYVEGDDIRVRAVQDVNGRYTMGRLAIGFVGCLEPGESAAWLILPWGNEAKERCRSVAGCLSGSVRFVRTSPLTLRGQAMLMGSALLISKDSDALMASVRAVLDQAWIHRTGQ